MQVLTPLTNSCGNVDEAGVFFPGNTGGSEGLDFEVMGGRHEFILCGDSQDLA